MVQALCGISLFFSYFRSHCDIYRPKTTTIFCYQYFRQTFFEATANNGRTCKSFLPLGV